MIPKAVTKISRCRVDTTIRRGIARDFFWFYFSFPMKEAGEIPTTTPTHRVLIASLSNDDGDGNGNDKKAIG